MSLLNLRRLLNLILGVKEDYLDKLTNFEDFQPLDPERVDIRQLVSYSYDGTLIAKLNVDQAKCDTLQKMVVQEFMRIIEKVQTVPGAFEFGKESLSPEASSDHKSQIQQLYEGSKTYQTLKKEITEANSKIQHLKISLKTRDEHLDKMKSTLLKDVVHLRETVGCAEPAARTRNRAVRRRGYPPRRVFFHLRPRRRDFDQAFQRAALEISGDHRQAVGQVD